MFNLRKLCLFALFLAMASLANAGQIVFQGNDNLGHTAQAVFTSDGNTLTVQLSNISLSDVLAPVDVLTALFFDVRGDGELQPQGAKVAPGSKTIRFATQPANVGGEWDYRKLSGNNDTGRHYGISSVGLGLFEHGAFDGPNLDGPLSVAGLQFGITSKGDDPNTGNMGQNVPLVQHSVQFTFNTLDRLEANQIYNVLFQYGSELNELQLNGMVAAPVPEPASMLLIGAGLAGIAIIIKRRVS